MGNKGLVNEAMKRWMDVKQLKVVTGNGENNGEDYEGREGKEGHVVVGQRKALMFQRRLSFVDGRLVSSQISAVLCNPLENSKTKRPKQCKKVRALTLTPT